MVEFVDCELGVDKEGTSYSMDIWDSGDIVIFMRDRGNDQSVYITSEIVPAIIKELIYWDQTFGSGTLHEHTE